MEKQHTITLNNGIEMLMIGYGTYRTPQSKTEAAVREALELGYRSIDTAQCYGNEAGVGRAVKASGIDREEIFLTTKTWTNAYKDTKRSIDESLRALGTDYVDLLLIHEPTGDISGIYEALEETYDKGKARAIGLSNFMGSVLEETTKGAWIKPAVNQVETHPLRQQAELQKVCQKHGIVMESWSPLVAGNRAMLSDPVITSIAHAHGRTPAQVVLRWLVQRGIPVIPKSMSPAHMRENLEIFDFGLSEDEMRSIASMDTDRSQFGWW